MKELVSKIHKKITRKKTYKRIIRMIHSGKLDGYIPLAENGFWQYRCVPTKSLNKAAALFNQICGKTIIEIGTGIHGKWAGNSMLVWPQKTSAKRIIAIDLEQERIDEVREVTCQYANVELVLADGIEYLKQFSERIDLLYLDFWTPDPEGTIPGTGRAEAYREAYNAAKDKMNTHSMILIDDTDHIHPWKHTYIVPLARNDGYTVLYTGRQTLLKR